jgi:hypothetical protein
MQPVAGTNPRHSAHASAVQRQHFSATAGRGAPPRVPNGMARPSVRRCRRGSALLESVPVPLHLHSALL